LAATAAAAAAGAAVCAAVGALAVASTGAAPADEVLKLEIVALNHLRHGGAKEEILPRANRASSKATKLFLRK